MSPHDLDFFRDLLERQRAALEEDGPFKIDPLRDDAVSKVDDDATPLSEMSQVIASNRNKNRSATLARIKAAIRRLERDPEDFGLCEDCEEPIPRPRMELMPWAVACVKCLGAREATPGRGRKSLTDYS